VVTAGYAVLELRMQILLLLRGESENPLLLLHTAQLTREGGLIECGAGLGHALAIHVNLALRPVGSHLLVCAAPDGWVLL
jgi:hypothetical protein